MESEQTRHKTSNRCLKTKPDAYEIANLRQLTDTVQGTLNVRRSFTFGFVPKGLR